MAIRVEETQSGNVTILAISGRITLEDAGSGQFRDRVLRLLQEGKKAILIDLGEVSYIDSSGIGEMVSGYTFVSNKGGELKLLNLTKGVRDLLQTTKLYTLFEVYDDKTMAIRSFS